MSTRRERVGYKHEQTSNSTATRRCMPPRPGGWRLPATARTTACTHSAAPPTTAVAIHARPRRRRKTTLGMPARATFSSRGASPHACLVPCARTQKQRERERSCRRTGSSLWSSLQRRSLPTRLARTPAATPLTPTATTAAMAPSTPSARTAPTATTAVTVEADSLLHHLHRRRRLVARPARHNFIKPAQELLAGPRAARAPTVTGAAAAGRVASSSKTDRRPHSALRAAIAAGRTASTGGTSGRAAVRPAQHGEERRRLRLRRHRLCRHRSPRHRRRRPRRRRD